MNRHLGLIALLLAFSALDLHGACAADAKPWSNRAKRNCYLFMAELTRRTMSEDVAPVVLLADGTHVPISRAFEKEGLPYSDIAIWFDRVDRVAFEKKLLTRLELEKSGKAPAKLSDWLIQWVNDPKLRTIRLDEMPEDIASTIRIPSETKIADVLREVPVAEKADAARRVAEYLSGRDNPFDLLSVEAREDLIYDEYLSFDDIRSSDRTPKFLTVGNDLGSYEVRSVAGEADFKKYLKQRDIVEEGLESSVGHQHIVHAWSEDAAKRAEMAPQYIELLDSSTWYLFWRQAKRDPEEVESILSHPFLGVYNRSALEKLDKAVIDGDVNAFNNKYRMVGARRLKGDPAIPGQEGKILADWEFRSGNKSGVRDRTTDMVAARITTGDFKGLKDFRSYKFDASAPIEELVDGLVDEEGVRALKLFQERYPYMNWSPSARAYNHVRNKVIAPLLPWENRLDLGAKLPIFEEQRRKFANELVDIARKYISRERDVREAGNRYGLIQLRRKTLGRLEEAVFKFSDAVRLDQNLERSIMPLAPKPPRILVKPSGPIDVNDIPLGIEYSFRFPLPPKNRVEADAQIKSAVEAFQKKMGGGGTIEKVSDGGHGHGLSIRYVYTDPQKRRWRFEWDGILRSYRDQEAYWTRRGHIEVPTPKFVPKDTQDIENLYETMRSQGNFPMRSAGGAHVNVDLSRLRELPEKEGARKMANLIATFESNREMVSALWQHPYRVRSGIPVQIDDEFIYKLTEFNGDWQDLGKLLYESKYFNTYVTRKPGYTQLNLMALMSEEIPEDYARTIDIKKPGTKWFPSFGGKGKDRIEWRLFDAPEDEYMAALQIKYVRALLDKGLNAEGTVSLVRRHVAGDRQIWKEFPEKFMAAAEQHLKELGLNPEEFSPALRESVEIQAIEPSPKPPLKEYNRFKQRISLEEGPIDKPFTPKEIIKISRVRSQDLKADAKNLSEEYESFVKRPSQRTLLSAMDAYDWVVRRLEALTASNGALITGAAQADLKTINDAVQLMEKLPKLDMREVGKWIPEEKRREFAVQIGQFQNARAASNVVLSNVKKFLPKT